MPGVRCRRLARPIAAVGLYVPGGSAVLPSSALMLAVPAALAGCSTIVLATPPRADSSITPEVLYCARKAGVTHVLKAGGAQAVAAMAWGTATCPKVDKICGPGNQFVTAAKMVLQNSEAMVAIDMPAGPSEVMVIADAGADPVHIAIDLLSQVRACVCGGGGEWGAGRKGLGVQRGGVLQEGDGVGHWAQPQAPPLAAKRAAGPASQRALRAMAQCHRSAPPCWSRGGGVPASAGSCCCCAPRPAQPPRSLLPWPPAG